MDWSNCLDWEIPFGLNGLTFITDEVKSSKLTPQGKPAELPSLARICYAVCLV